MQNPKQPFTLAVLDHLIQQLLTESLDMRNIKTHYFDHKRETLKVNSSSDANHAVATCVLHMQINRYGATSAQVYDDSNGELHADIRRHQSGTITIQYKRDPAKYERRLSLLAFKDVG